MEPAGLLMYRPLAGCDVFHTLSLDPRKLIQIKTLTHTRHTFAATHLKTQLAQIIKINTLEAWHYAKETSHL